MDNPQGAAGRLVAESLMPHRRPRATSARKSQGQGARVRRESDRFFSYLFASMRNGVLAITREGTVAEINAEAYRIFKLKRSPSAVGRPFAEVLAKHPDMVRVLRSAFELRHLPNRAELRLKSTGKVIGYTLSHVRTERGRSLGVGLFFKDLMKVEQLEERERLRDRLVALGEMAAAIAHEVKNPLAGIEVMAGVLKRQLTDADAQSILSDIINEAKMANQIVHEALEFVRPIRLQVEHTAIANVIQSAVSLAENKVPRRGINLQVRLDNGLPPIQGDHHQLTQLFTNLLINAFEALEGRGTVQLTAHEGLLEEELHGPSGETHLSTRTVVIEVADDGPGVPKELTDRIFNAFFTTKPQGSGLGLAIVRKIVDAHDGRIDIISGTRFRVTLPVSGADDWFVPKSDRPRTSTDD
ncbi:MAG: PAS domain-containing protein [Acidobacteria bacterium]|nr:PAS domain-containing protein [Acidobacteriota bacterium]